LWAVLFERRQHPSDYESVRRYGLARFRQKPDDEVRPETAVVHDPPAEPSLLCWTTTLHLVDVTYSLSSSRGPAPEFLHNRNPSVTWYWPAQPTIIPAILPGTAWAQTGKRESRESGTGRKT